MLAVSVVGWLIVIVLLATQPFESVTVTVCIPATKLVLLPVVAPPGDHT